METRFPIWVVRGWSFCAGQISYTINFLPTVLELIKSGKFLWVKNRDSRPSVRHWHSKTEILYAVSFTVILLLFFLLYLVFLSKFSVPFCSVFCLSVYFCCSTWVFSACSASECHCFERNWIPLILFHLLSHRGWQMTNTVKGESSISMNVSTPWLVEKNIAFGLLKMLVVNAN